MSSVYESEPTPVIYEGFQVQYLTYVVFSIMVDVIIIGIGNPISCHSDATSSSRFNLDGTSYKTGCNLFSMKWSLPLYYNSFLGLQLQSTEPLGGLK